MWGSYYDMANGRWCYACCHSAVKNSYCAGNAAIEAAEAEARGGLALLTDRAVAREKTVVELKAEQDAAAKGAKSGKAARGEKVALGEGDVDARLDPKKLEDALKGTSKTFGGAPVTEEEMGECFLFWFCLLESGTYVAPSCLQRRTSGLGRWRSTTRWRTWLGRSCCRCKGFPDCQPDLVLVLYSPPVRAFCSPATPVSSTTPVRGPRPPGTNAPVLPERVKVSVSSFSPASGERRKS